MSEETGLPTKRELCSSLRQMEDFVNSSVWADIRGWLADKRVHARAGLEDVSLTLEELRFVQGRLAEIRELLALPESIKSELEDLERTKK